jgi:hypothetical protein
MAEDAVCAGFFRAAEGAKISCLDQFQEGNLISFILGNLLEAFYNFFAAVLNPSMWLDWSNSEALMRFIYYGASVELFFVLLVGLLIVTAVGIWKRCNRSSLSSCNVFSPGLISLSALVFRCSSTSAGLRKS